MPKLKTSTITASNKAGESLTLNSEISVTTWGDFRAHIPTHLADDTEFMACVNNVISERRADGKRDIATDKPKIHTYLVSKDLTALTDVLQASAERFIDVETTTETVILYATEANVSFALTKDGRASQNGYTAGDGYTWPEDKGINTARRGGSTYSVGLWAHVYTKTTHTRGDKQIVRYEGVSARHAGDNTPAARLNAFLGMHDTIPAQGNGVRDVYRGDFRREFNEIPFTPEAAEFFISMLLSMCELARRMSGFFDDTARLQLAIASGSLPQLLAPSNKEA